MTEWKQIKGYPNYCVSSDGDVKSVRFNRILKGSKNSSGYLYVNLSHENRIKSHAVHKLVLEAFGIEKPSSDFVVDHIDSNKTNNKIDNLQWLSITENTLKHYGNAEKKKHILYLREQGMTMSKIASEVGLSVATVHQTISNSA